MNDNESQPRIAFGTRVRKSPFFAATRRWGCEAYSVYNHVYMPVSYSGPESEYQQLVNHVTLWDVACEVQVQIEGPDAPKLTQYLVPRDLSEMAVGQAKYVPMVNAQGGLLNDPLLLRISNDCYWFSLADSDILLWAQGVATSNSYQVEITEPDVSPLQLQGPAATKVAQALFGDWVLDLKYFWFKELELDGIPLLISRTGWSNERGYELFLRDGSRGDELWEKIMSAGKPFNISAACPNQIKRMEAGLLSYRNDMDIGNNPFEVGLGKFVELDKPFDFVGKQALKEIAEKGVSRKLLGAIIAGNPLPVNAERWPVYSGDQRVGELTSCAYSPSMEANIAYVMVSIALARPDQTVSIETCDGRREARLCELPFVSSRAN